MRNTALLVVAALLLLAGCGDDSGPAAGTQPDADVSDSGTSPNDVGALDVGEGVDAPSDTGAPDVSQDAGGADVAVDAGTDVVVPVDTGTGDTGMADAGVEDTAATDTGSEDTGVTDTGPEDTGATDTGAEDTAIIPDVATQDVAADIGAEDIGSADADAGQNPPECASLCDCPQGFGCAAGECVLGDVSVFCCENDGCTDGESCTHSDGSPGLCGVDASPLYGVILFNEVLSDGAVDGDPNGDGDPGDAVGDEFVELVNAGAATVDLSGWKLVETDFPFLPRHTFEGTTLAAGKALVVFGGGSAPDDTAGTQFFTANALDPGQPFGLNLDNDGEALKLVDADGKLVALFAYGPGTSLVALSDQSYTRSPDVTGGFMPHAEATGDPSNLFSPGTHADGSSF